MAQSLFCLTLLALIGSLSWNFFDFVIDEHLRQEGSLQTNGYELVNVTQEGSTFIFEAVLKSHIPFYGSIGNFKASSIILKVQPICEDILNIKFYDKSKPEPYSNSNLNNTECSAFYSNRLKASIQNHEEHEKKHHHDKDHVHHENETERIYNESHKFSVSYKSNPFSVEVRDQKSKVLLLDTSIFDFVIGSEMSTFTSPLLNNSVHVPGDFDIEYNKVYSAMDFGSFPFFFAKSQLKFVHGYFFNTDKPLSIEFKNHLRLEEDQFTIKSYTDNMNFYIATEEEFSRLTSKLKQNPQKFGTRVQKITEFLSNLENDKDKEFVKYECLQNKNVDFLTSLKKSFAYSIGNKVKTAKEVKSDFEIHQECDRNMEKIAENSGKSPLSINGLFFNGERLLLEGKNIKEIHNLVAGMSMAGKAIAAMNVTKSSELLLADVSLVSKNYNSNEDHFFSIKNSLISHKKMLKSKNQNLLFPIFFIGEFNEKHKNWISQLILHDNIMIVNYPNFNDNILTYFPEYNWIDLNKEKISPKGGALKSPASVYLRHSSIVQFNRPNEDECNFDIYGMFHGMTVMNMKTFMADGYISCKNSRYHLNFIGTNFKSKPNINLRVSRDYGEDPFALYFLRFYNYDIDGQIDSVKEGGTIFQHNKDEFSLLFDEGLKISTKDEIQFELINVKDEE